MTGDLGDLSDVTMSGDDETRLPAGLPGAGPRQAMSLPHNIRPDQMVGPETPGETITEGRGAEG